MKKLICLLLMIGSCRKAPEKFEPTDPTAEVLADYHQVSQALVGGHTYGGFGIVSRDPDGKPVHLGEALIWGGTAMWALPCDDGRALSASLAAKIDELGGQLIRVDPLGEYENGGEITVDGEIGAMLGIARRITDCGEADLWRGPFAKMVAFQNSNGQLMNKHAPNRLPVGFDFIRDAIGEKLGISSGPTRPQSDLEKIVGDWAFAVKVAHVTKIGSDAAYRVNLGLDTLLTLEALGLEVSSAGRNQFCDSTDEGMDIPTVDHWCGRKPIGDYIVSYQKDLWEMRHQRAGGWELPDGHGNSSGSLDKLVAYVLDHGWHRLQ